MINSNLQVYRDFLITLYIMYYIFFILYFWSDMVFYSFLVEAVWHPSASVWRPSFLCAYGYMHRHIDKICIWKWRTSNESATLAPWIKLQLHKVDTCVVKCKLEMHKSCGIANMWIVREDLNFASPVPCKFS